MVLLPQTLSGQIDGEFIEGRNSWEVEMDRPLPTGSIAVNGDGLRGVPEQRTMGEGENRRRRALFPEW